MNCSYQYWYIILFVLISESSTSIFSLIDYFEIEYFRKFLINEKKEFLNKKDIKKCLNYTIDGYKKIILPIFLIGIITCNTLYIRPFQCDYKNYNIYISLFRLITYVIFADLLFYIIHRIMHIPYFYKLYHKKHHEYKITFALVKHYVSFEELTVFMTPIVLPAILLNVHIYELYFVSFLFNFYAGYTHSGYNFPLLKKIGFDSKHHDNHHVYFNYNYSALLPIIDKLFNTYL